MRLLSTTAGVLWAAGPRQARQASLRARETIITPASPAEELTILHGLKIFWSFLVMNKCLSMGSDQAKPFQGW